MKINHNGKSYECPASLSEITLRQVSAFQLKYGKEIEDFQKNCDPDDELTKLEINMDMACKSVSFFTGIPLDEVYKTNIAQVFTIFDEILSPIFKPQDERELYQSYQFNNAMWTIASPQLTFQNSMTFNELILGKQIVNDMQSFAAGKYDALQRLAVVYFRQIDADGNIEQLDENWLSDEDSERMNLMADLPMDIVLDVAFFLLSSMTTYLISSQYSPDQK